MLKIDVLSGLPTDRSQSETTEGEEDEDRIGRTDRKGPADCAEGKEETSKESDPVHLTITSQRLRTEVGAARSSIQHRVLDVSVPRW